MRVLRLRPSETAAVRRNRWRSRAQELVAMPESRLNVQPTAPGPPRERGAAPSLRSLRDRRLAAGAADPRSGRCGSSSPLAIVFSGSMRTASPGPQWSSSPRTARSTSSRIEGPAGETSGSGRRGRSLGGRKLPHGTCVRLYGRPFGLTQAPARDPIAAPLAQSTWKCPGQFCGRRRSQAGSPPSQVRPSPTKSGQVRLFGRAHSATRSALLLRFSIA